MAGAHRIAPDTSPRTPRLLPGIPASFRKRRAPKARQQIRNAGAPVASWKSVSVLTLALPTSVLTPSLVHAFLELLRHRLPHSLEHMLAFVYLAYSMMSLLYETVPAFEDTWVECLGDLSRYRYYSSPLSIYVRYLHALVWL